MTDAPATAAPASPVTGFVSLSAIEIIFRVLTAAETARDHARAQHDELGRRYAAASAALSNADDNIADLSAQRDRFRAERDQADAALANALRILAEHRDAAVRAEHVARASDADDDEVEYMAGRASSLLAAHAAILRELGRP